MLSNSIPANLLKILSFPGDRCILTAIGIRYNRPLCDNYTCGSEAARWSKQIWWSLFQALVQNRLLGNRLILLSLSWCRLRFQIQHFYMKIKYWHVRLFIYARSKHVQINNRLFEGTVEDSTHLVLTRKPQWKSLDIGCFQLLHWGLLEHCAKLNQVSITFCCTFDVIPFSCRNSSHTIRYSCTMLPRIQSNASITYCLKAIVNHRALLI